MAVRVAGQRDLGKEVRSGARLGILSSIGKRVWQKDGSLEVERQCAFVTVSHPARNVLREFLKGDVFPGFPHSAYLNLDSKK